MPKRCLLLAGTLFAGSLAIAGPAHAFPPSFEPPVHNLLVFLHVFGAIIFMGNIIVTAMWMASAKRTHDAAVLHFASKAVIRADWIFVVPGIVLILVPGVLAIGPWGGFGRASWADLALALFVLTGIVWGVFLIPAQKRMLQLSREAVELKMALSDRFYSALRNWMIWGGVATLLPMIALVLMVFKPFLWGNAE